MKKINFLTECHKNAYNDESSLSKIFLPVSNQGTNQTRNSEALSMQVPNIRSCIGRKSYSYRGPFNWNSVTPENRKTESLNVFKSNLTKDMCRNVNVPG